MKIVVRVMRANHLSAWLICISKLHLIERCGNFVWQLHFGEKSIYQKQKINLYALYYGSHRWEAGIFLRGAAESEMVVEIKASKLHIDEKSGVVILKRQIW